MRNRNNVLVALGIAFFVIGAALVFLISGDDGDGGSDGAANSAVPPVAVLVATENIAAGVRGDDVIAEEKVEIKQVPPDQVVAGALGSFAQLRGATFTTPFGKGEQLIAVGVRQDPLAAGGIVIPEGFEAVAIDIPAIPGAAGYASPGARVNVYGVLPAGFSDSSGAVSFATPRVELVLTNVEVLDVNTVIPALRGQDEAAERAAAPQLTYLFALDPEDVERSIVLRQFAEIWLTILRQDAGDTPDTPGRSAFDLLNDTPTSGAAPTPAPSAPDNDESASEEPAA